MSNKVYDVVRLVMTSALSDRQIGHSLHVAKNTVRRYRGLIAKHQYSWEELGKLDTSALEAKFNQGRRHLVQKRRPDFAWLHQEMQRTGVTLQLLWEEYRADGPEDALSYSQFTHQYRQYCGTLKRSMRQLHRPGEKAFVDFSGKKPKWIDRTTNEVHSVELFVGVLGYSNLVFAWAVPSQTVADWIDCHVAMFEAFGGAPSILVPDNLKAAVVKAGAEPIINRTYLELSSHYDTAILPARARRPKDKPKAEQSVQHVQRWVLARLRNQTFFSLESLNQEITRLVADINERPFKRIPGCRRSRFEAYEKDKLQKLPAERFEYCQWTAEQTVPPDYHVHIDGHWYSVPFQLIGGAVEGRIGSHTIEVFSKRKRVASHARSYEVGAHTTAPEHQPPNHRAYAERSPETFIEWAAGIGPNTLAVVKHQFARKVPVLGMPACDSLRRLGKQHGAEILELAAKRAVEIQSPTVKSVRSLISTKRYRAEIANDDTSPNPPMSHHNLRGAEYFTTQGGEAC